MLFQVPRTIPILYTTCSANSYTNKRCSLCALISHAFTISVVELEGTASLPYIEISLTNNISLFLHHHNFILLYITKPIHSPTHPTNPPRSSHRHHHNAAIMLPSTNRSSCGFQLVFLSASTEALLPYFEQHTLLELSVHVIVWSIIRDV